MKKLEEIHNNHQLLQILKKVATINPSTPPYNSKNKLPKFVFTITLGLKVRDVLWAQGGLNPWPTGYEPVALPG
jgi:hypothetical protein